MWFISGADGLRRFDGTDWSAPAAILNSDLNWRPGTGALAVSSDGSAWLVGNEALVKVTRAGGTEIYGRDSGFASVAGLAVGAGDAVVISDVPRVRRLDGERFEEIWADLNGAGIGAVHAVSADETWIQRSGHLVPVAAGGVARARSRLGVLRCSGRHGRCVLHWPPADVFDAPCCQKLHGRYVQLLGGHCPNVKKSRHPLRLLAFVIATGCSPDRTPNGLLLGVHGLGSGCGR